MKTVRLAVFSTLVIILCVGCSHILDRPSRADVDKAVKKSRISSGRNFVIDKVDYGGKTREGVYVVAVWGHTEDKLPVINALAVFSFTKSGDTWVGFLPQYGGVTAEPDKEKDRKTFYKETAEQWKEFKRGL